MTERRCTTNGGSRYQTDKVRVAIVGVGNCASSFVQGVQYYRDADAGRTCPGLMHVDLGGYHVRDIEFTAAFDIDADKVGKDLSEAIWSGQNNTIKFADVPKLGVPVHRGMTHDGLGKYLKEKITKAPGETADIVEILKETKTDVVVSYLPVGSEQATKWYVEQVLEAGCGFVNCIPVFIAREDYWAKRFAKAGLPIVGDDIKSQVGATIVHRQLARLFADRGVKMMRTSQLNVGGNMDFYNMLERERLESKKISKTNAVTSIMDHELPADDVYIGPSDYVPWLTDRKWAHIRVEGQAFGDVPLNVEMKLEVWDSPNSAGIVIDAVAAASSRSTTAIGGPLEAPSSYLMKSPPVQVPDSSRATTRSDSSPSTAARRSCPARAGSARRRAPERQAPLRPADARPGRASGVSSPRGAERFTIAQVTPYAWEQHHEVNRFVERLSDELCRARAPRRGRRAVGLAPADPRVARADRRRSPTTPSACSRATAARRSWAWARASRSRRGRGAGARCRSRSTSRGRSRSCSTAPTSTSCTCTSRSRRARPRPRCATRARSTSARSTRPPSACSRPRSPAASSSSSSAGSTGAPPASGRPRELVEPLLPRRLPDRPAGRRPRASDRARADDDVVRDRLLRRGGARCAAAVPARAAQAARRRCRGGPRSGRGGRGAADRPARCARSRDRVRFAGPADGSEAQHLARADVARGRLDRRGARAAAPPAGAGRRRRARGVAAARSTRRLLREGELGLLFEPRDAETLAAQLARLVEDGDLSGAPARPRVRGTRAELDWVGVTADGFERLYDEIAARRHRPDGKPAVRDAARLARR